MALNFDHQRNRISSSSNNITINTNGGLTLPVGSTGDRPTPAQGMIRYNTTDNRFEAYNGTVWTGLGGVIDTDQNTYIIAESSPGANNNELDFYTDGVKRLQVGSSGNLLFGDTLNKFTVAYATGNTAIAGTLNVTGNTTLGGASISNLTVTGNFVINSTAVTVKDPVITIGGLTELDTDDNKDRGIEFRWHNGTDPKLGFFGFDDSTGYFTFIPDATNTSEVFSGTAGSAAFHAVYATHLIGSNVQIGVAGSNEINTSSGNITIDSAGGTTTINDILLVNGATTVNSLNVKDTAIVLNSDEAGTPASDVYITVERGTSNNVGLRWNETSEVWEQTSNGTNYYRIVSTDDDYIANLTAGTGISITHTPSAGSTATIATANIPNSSLTNSAITITDGATSQVIDLGETITFADGTDINVTVSATNTLTVNHSVGGANTSATAATNTFANAYTVTSQGHVTSIGTGTVNFNVADNYAFKSITDGTNTAIADSNTETFKIRSTDQIEVTVTNNDITHGDSLLIGHADSGVTANTYGSSTAVPVITINAQGHITSASTASISTQWTITDGTTSQTINGGDTLTLADGTDINVVVSSTDTVTINNISTFDTVTDRGATTTNSITVGGATVSNLTNTRIVLAGASGVLADSTNLTFDGSTLNATAAVNITGDLDVDNININGNTISSTDTNGNIVIEPNGSGDVQLNSDTIRVGDSNTAVLITSNGTGNIRFDTNAGTNSGYVLINSGVNGDIQIEPNGTGSVYNTTAKLILGKSNAATSLTTNGTGNLTLNTNSGTNSGSIVITQGANANITLTPNGTGEVVLSTASVTDLTVNRIVFAGASGALSDSASFRFDGTNFDIGASGSEKFRVVVASGNTTVGGTLGFAAGVTVNTILDEDNMASDSATALATQQSIKAYVDAATSANSLAIAGGTGTGSVTLSTQTLTIAGTTNEIETSVSGQTITIGLPNSVTIGSNLTVTGDLTVNGTTTTVNSTTVTLDDPILTLGGNTLPSVDDNKDRGIEFRYYNGSAKIGFFGFDDSTGYFTFIPDATNTSEVFTGTKGVLDVSSITGSSASWTTARTITLGGDLTGNVSIDGSGDVTLTATVASNSVALGTDTSGNYVASITNGSYITGGNGGSEGAGLTLAVDATSANTVSKVVARDSSGNFSAGTITAALSGNASTASAWATARTITLGGDLTGNVSIDGSGDVTLTATVASNSVALGTDTSGDYVATVSAGTSSTQTGSSGLTITGTGEGSSVTIAHADTSTVSNLSSDNSNGVVLQDISFTFDTYGHVTAASVSTLDLDGRYYTETEADNNFVNVSGDTLTGYLTLHADPTNALHAVTRQYVDAIAEGLHVHEACLVATTDTLATLSGGTITYDNGTSGVNATLTTTGSYTTIDTVTLANTNRILVKNEATAAHNGIYVRTSSTVLTRASDHDSTTEMAGGDFVFVTGGDQYDNTGWVQESNVATVGTSAVSFVQFSGQGTYDAGTGLQLLGSIFSIDSTVATLTGSQTLTNKTLTSPTISGLYLSDSSIVFEGSTSDAYETTLTVTDPTADRIITLPDVTGTIITTGDTATVTNTMLAGSIANSKLSNSAITVGTTSIALGASSTTLAGLTSVTSTSFVGGLTGNADTATKWATARTITLGGDLTGNVSIDGSGDVTLTATVASNSVALGTDTSGNYVASITNGSYITGGDGGSEGAGLTLAVDATSTNTVSKVVARDSSGNFAAGTITAALSGNATTATAWASSRTITLGGDLTGNVSIDGSANVTLTATIAADSVALGTDTTGNYVAAGAVSGNGLSGSASSEGATFTVTSNATNLNTPSTIVFRDSSSNFTAGTITAALTGNVTGNADTATTLATTRTLWGQNFNGSANVTGNLTSVGDITGTSAITITAGGSNQNITLTPTGTGYTLLNGNVGINVATPLEKLHVDGAVRIDSTYNLDSATATVASISQTSIASFSSTTFGGGKVVIQAYDSVTGNRTICELLIVHNGTTASATEYGIINTGASAIATYDVDINGGNVRILATGASSNSTQYKIVQTLILA